MDDPGRGPVLVLGTIWPDADRWGTLVSEPPAGTPDPRARARLLLRGHDVRVPETVTATDATALRTAAEQDRRLAVALDRGGDRPIQYLAGDRELLRRDSADPTDRAVVDAAGDARRIGVPHPLSAASLEQAALITSARSTATASLRASRTPG